MFLLVGGEDQLRLSDLSFEAVDLKTPPDGITGRGLSYG
jgi:hypothetical protein